MIGGGVFRYKMTGNNPHPIYISNWDVWIADPFIPTLFGAIDSDTTAEYVCDKILNICSDEQESKSKSYKQKSKSTKSSKSDKSSGKGGKANKSAKKKMAKCLSRLKSLPSNDNGYWIDGDTRHCRILHGFYARTNTVHCPHITFEKEDNVHGKCKCCESKGWKAEDIFSEEQLNFFISVSLPYELPNASSDPYFQVYSAGSEPAIN